MENRQRRSILLLVIFAFWGFSATGIIVRRLMAYNIESVNNFLAHNWFQDLPEFIGASLAIFIYLIQKWRFKRQLNRSQLSEGMRKAMLQSFRSNVNPLIFAIPIILLYFSNVLMAIAEIYANPLIFGLFLIFRILFFAFLSKVFLGKKFEKHHILSLIVIVIAALIILIENFMNPETPHDAMIGILAMIGYLILSCCSYIIIEKLFQKYYISPIEVSGWVGIWATIFLLVLLTIYQNINWYSEKLCCNGKVEDSLGAITEMVSHYEIILYFLFRTIFYMLIFILSYTILKHSNAISYVIVLKIRDIFVMVFFVLYHGRGHVEFEVAKFCGSLVLLFGGLIYMEIVEIRWFGLDRNTVRAVEERERKEIQESSFHNYSILTTDNEKTSLLENSARENPSNISIISYQS